jgi:hypothetical protein
VEVLTRAEGEFETGQLVVKARGRRCARARKNRCPQLRCPNNAAWCVCAQGGVTLACGLSAAQRARGTTVCVRAFMFNQPVRRNALLAECVKATRKPSFLVSY